MMKYFEAHLNLINSKYAFQCPAAHNILETYSVLIKMYIVQQYWFTLLCKDSQLYFWNRITEELWGLVNNDFFNVSIIILILKTTLKNLLYRYKKYLTLTPMSMRGNFYNAQFKWWSKTLSQNHEDKHLWFSKRNKSIEALKVQFSFKISNVNILLIWRNFRD